MFRRTFQTLLSLLIIVSACTLLFGMGSVHPVDKEGRVVVPAREGIGGWPDDLEELIRSSQCVHGHWVNSSDEFFFTGDTESLNGFLERYASLGLVQPKVTLHAGSERRSQLWGDKPTIPYEWSLFILNPVDIRVDIWIADTIKLSKLKIPNSIDLSSAGEIDRFIKNAQSGN